MTRHTRILKDVLWIFALGGLVAGVLRFGFGLGATTNLTDEAPWGLWKVLNMVAGVALSTGGFTIGFLVYVLRLERFRPLVKPAILIAFLGYGSSCLALAFDIGIPYRFWHPFVMWNEHSFLFEVFWCVMIYFTVTFIEVLAPVLERFGAQRPVELLHKITFGVVVFGISLSSLHHSSLGSLFLVTPLRLHALWYSPLLPLFFILSAMGTGMMFVIMMRILYAYLYDPEPIFGKSAAGSLIGVCNVDDETTDTRRGKDMPMLSRLSVIAASILAVYLVIKLVDLGRTGNWSVLMSGSWESILYASELVFGVIVPIVLVAMPHTRRSPFSLGVAGFLTSAGLVLNRMDVGILGYWRNAGAPYVPSAVEWAVTLGIMAATCLVFMWIIENVSIFDEIWRSKRAAGKKFRASFDVFTHVWDTTLSNMPQRVSLIAVVVLPLAVLAFYPPYHNQGAESAEVQPPLGVDVARATLRIDSNRGGVLTDFQHVDHQQRLGGDESCVTCHHIALPADNATPCSRCHRYLTDPTELFDHSAHLTFVAHKENLSGVQPQNQSCDICHSTGQAKTAANAKTCYECHREDMRLPDEAVERVDLAHASSYETAMHATCLACHTQKAVELGKPHLPECGTCHPSLLPKENLFAAR